MKRFFFLVVVVALVVSALPQHQQAQPAQAAGETLDIYITGLNQTTIDWFNDVAFPAFKEEHPDVELSIITGGWGDFDVSVANWIQTGDGPDIIYLGSEYAATYGDQLADLDPYLAEWEGLEAFLPAALDTVTWDGHLRGLPLLMSPRPIFYRTDLVADPEAELPATFADALAFVEANSVVEDGAMAQMGFIDIGNALFDAQELIGYIWSSGGELYNEDGTSTFDSAETAEALQFMYDRRRVMTPTEDTAGLPTFEGSPLASGLVVSGIQPMWAMPPVDDPVWENIAIAPYPAGENGEQLIQVFIDWLSVPAYSENQEIAVEFLKFITSKENALELSTVAGFTPVREDAWEDIRANSPVWDAMLTATVEYGRAFSDIRASAALRPLILSEVNLFLTDQQSLEDTQANLKEQYDAILEEEGYLD